MSAFLDKGRISHVVEKIPVRIALVDDLGMKGAHFVSTRIAQEATSGHSTNEGQLSEWTRNSIVAVAAAVLLTGIFAARNH